jgi:serine/threonine protein kinase
VSESDIENEARVIALFISKGGHTNIVSVFDHGFRRIFNLYVIDMELCDITLAKYLKYSFRSGDLPFMVDSSLKPAMATRNASTLAKMETALTICLHIARGLEFVHSHKQVHRDLTPNNGRPETPSSVDDYSALFCE